MTNISGAPGIADNTIIIDGPLTDIGFFFAAVNPSLALLTFDFLLDATTTTPSLGFGPVVGGIVSQAFVTVSDVSNPFASSFALNSSFGQPVVDTFHVNTVPVPAPVSLMLVGVVALVVKQHRTARQI